MMFLLHLHFRQAYNQMGKALLTSCHGQHIHQKCICQTFQSFSGNIFKGGHREDGRKSEKGRGVRECQGRLRTAKEDKAEANGKSETHKGSKGLCCSISSGVIREPAGRTCEKEEKKPGRQRKKVDGDEKDSFFI